MGGGKTLFMTSRGYRKYLAGYSVKANYGVRFPHEKLNAKSLEEMGADLQDCVILGDEFHILIDSRDSMKKRNKTISYFILQTRKRGVHLYFTTQDEGQVDIRLRRMVDYWVYCRRIGKHHFRYRIYNRRGRKLGTLILDGRKYYRLFDTTETITDFSNDDSAEERARDYATRIRKNEKWSTIGGDN